jgi:hypothetical protein
MVIAVKHVSEMITLIIDYFIISTITLRELIYEYWQLIAS